MALEETRSFLEDLLLRYDPDIDLSDGSRAQTEVVDPILTRVGPDPFDEDISTFIIDRVRQVYPDLAFSEEDAFRDTVVDPMRILIEPIVREIKLVKLRSSLDNIESLSDDEVDALLANMFESRQAGGYSTGVVRAYFSIPQSVSVGLQSPASTRGGLRFFTTRPQSITADQMLLNVDGSEYYFDINYTAENRGDEYNVEAGSIVSIANLTTAVRVVNPRKFRNGVARETSTSFAARAEESQGDKTLTVSRGINRTLTEAFPGIRQLFSVGFRDPEMQRDVVTGGALGNIPGDDTAGAFSGTGSPVDDLDGDLTTPRLQAATGAFVSRLGAVGTDPEQWYVSAAYTDPNTALPVFVDARVISVVSSTVVETDHEFPLSTPPVDVLWALRKRTLTITDIPGGVVFPDAATGNLEIEADEVHIGGKTDVYVSGDTEEGAAQLTSLSDEQPVARGVSARTDAALAVVAAADTVIVYDSPVLANDIVAGWSLSIEEGVDAGTYRILLATDVGSELHLLLDQEMTGSQPDLSWRIVDDITTNLMDPRTIKIEGSDLVTAAGSNTITTTSGTNFLDASVQVGDVVRLEGDDLLEGDYTVEEVSAVTIKITPVVAKTVTGVSYSVFTKSEPIEAPFVRITSMDLLDSGGSPVGTEVPYRDPVLCVGRAFQNEGARLSFEGRVKVGLVSDGISAGSAGFSVGGRELLWVQQDPQKAYTSALASGSYTFPAGTYTAAQVASVINAEPQFINAGVYASVLSYGGLEYVGFYSRYLTTLFGSAGAQLGLSSGITNATVRTLDTSGDLLGVLPEDVFEVIDGVNSGDTSRVLTVAYTSAYGGVIAAGDGPLGPYPTAYDNHLFNPDVGVRVQVGRPSVGSARAYFEAPTSAEFRYDETSFIVEGTTRSLEYRPDPSNTRTYLPANPNTDLPSTGVSSSGASSVAFVDTSVDFYYLGVTPGDILNIKYQPIDSTAPLATPAALAVAGLTLVVRLDIDQYLSIAFPYDLTRQEIVDYINEQVGEDIAAITGTGELRLQTLSRRLDISEDSTALAVLSLDGAPRTNEHPDAGSYIIAGLLDANTISLSSLTPLSGTEYLDTQYLLERYTQRVSATEMNENTDYTGLYYADVELRSVAPGNEYNIEEGNELEVSGHRADGYRLVVSNEATSYSRAEVVTAEISRTMLLVGSSDSPEEYVQLSGQNVQVSYDRSQLVDEVQSFVDADYDRVLCQEMLVRHLLPHYVNTNWTYSGGAAEPAAGQAMRAEILSVGPDTDFEVQQLIDSLKGIGAVSAYSVDEDKVSGRRAPLMVIIYHGADRRVRAKIVTDFINTTRAQAFIPDNLGVVRLTSGGIR